MICLKYCLNAHFSPEFFGIFQFHKSSTRHNFNHPCFTVNRCFHPNSSQFNEHLQINSDIRQNDIGCRLHHFVHSYIISTLSISNGYKISLATPQCLVIMVIFHVQRTNISYFAIPKTASHLVASQTVIMAVFQSAAFHGRNNGFFFSSGCTTINIH